MSNDPGSSFDTPTAEDVVYKGIRQKKQVVVIKKILVVVLSLGTIGFAILTASRLTLDYNEDGVYFDGVVTYDTDAIVGYGLITVTLLVATIGLQLVWKKKIKKAG